MTGGTITQDPDPCVRGDKVRFCLDIDGLSLPVTVTGNWDDAGNTEINHTVTSANDRCWDVDVPADATGGLLEGQGGVVDFGISVQP